MSTDLFLAKPATEAELDAIFASLGMQRPAAVELNLVIQPDLLEGYILISDYKRIDHSLKRRLAMIERSLKNNDVLSDKITLDVPEPTAEEIGIVTQAADGICFCEGLPHAMYGEMVRFDNGVEAVVMSLDQQQVGLIIIGRADEIRSSDICVRLGYMSSIRVGDALIGRVLDGLGRPIDRGPALPEDLPRYPLEKRALSVIYRIPVSEPLYSGITAIDAMIPIGKGQRELIVGDRQTGKTTIATDMILNQKGKNVYCIYVAIGQKMSTLASLVRMFERHGAMDYTTVIAASSSRPTAEVYYAPYAGCALAEYMMDQGRDVLIIYDDLTKHAQSYRQLSLLLRHSPGREAYPGDIFYIHSRLLERSARRKAGGSITAIPIIETQDNDISAYIPTNIISITDGQIYLEPDLFFAGQRPAINVGLSVSRVGGDAQVQVMRKSAGNLRANLAQYRELESFTRFGSDVESSTKEALALGSRLLEVLKQDKASPRTMEESVLLLQLAEHKAFSDIGLKDLGKIIEGFLRWLRAGYGSEVLQAVTAAKKVDEELYQRMYALFITFRSL